MKIGIVGNGFVGKATHHLANPNVECCVVDIRKELCIPPGTTITDMASCDIVFVCVPTPMEESGSCHLSMVESALESLHNVIDITRTSIILRSTVPPGTCDRMGCYFMPEFLTEKRYIHDVIECNNWVVGLRGMDTDAQLCENIKRLLQYAYDSGKINHRHVIFMNNKEAEMVKYVRNTFLATKVAFFNEIEMFCQMKNINYESIRRVAVLDSRIGESHTFVPGHDGHRGFGGTCFPKDTNALFQEMKHIGMESYILRAAITRNEEVDRLVGDWKEDKGRAVI